MIANRYIDWLKKDILPVIGEDGGAFIFGSSIQHDQFGDVDIAIWSKKVLTDRQIGDLHEHFEESIFPYFVDIVNISTTSEYFYKELVTTEKVWLSQTKDLPPRGEH